MGKQEEYPVTFLCTRNKNFTLENISCQSGAGVEYALTSVQILDLQVLRPPATAGRPEAVVHFLGGAFVGAAPQLTYRLFLETLANRNVLVSPNVLSYNCVALCLRSGQNVKT